ncbi:U32 family peptidase [Alicyclobacillus fodiniaquatilis]|jgi:hypothetical protein|uniref:U32 family peptidase n=1 Tax=Alicyclobacillus fodiniaquatilis TaxID=1661150 RepID=A0ABW4JHK4_9BACL
MFERARAAIAGLGFPSEDKALINGSEKRFADGAQARVEIPSCEGPEVLKAILEEAAQLDVTIHRVSQGSGVTLMTDAEILEMARLGAGAGIEVSLFVGPRADWDTGALAKSASGGIVRSRTRGADMLAHALEDVYRAYDLGIRSVLVADDGLLHLLGQLRQKGELPSDLKYKISVMMGIANPITAALLEQSGADTLNVSTDLTLPQLASIRSTTHVPLDIYVESPDDVGGFVRYYEIPALIQQCSPVYIKYGVRNAPNIYPSGAHIQQTAIALGRERVRRARIGQELLSRHMPKAIISQPGKPIADLAVPVVNA